MLGGIGPTELIVILFIVLIFFGAGKLPDIASGLGKGLRDFKKGMREPDEPDRRKPPEEPEDEPPRQEES
jgi:sec-independent protein translocase protein TatA